MRDGHDGAKGRAAGLDGDCRVQDARLTWRGAEATSVRCSHCGFYGHTFRLCPKPPAGPARHERLFCTYCGGHDHEHEACPRRRAPHLLFGPAPSPRLLCSVSHWGIPLRDKAQPVKALDRLRRDILTRSSTLQGKSTSSDRIGLSGCPGAPGWKGPRNRSGVQITCSHANRIAPMSFSVLSMRPLDLRKTGCYRTGLVSLVKPARKLLRLSRVTPARPDRSS
jgi:hypothetical protein